jgi:hypothetical protein
MTIEGNRGPGDLVASFEDRPTAIYLNGVRMREGGSHDYTVQKSENWAFELRMNYSIRDQDWVRAEF